MLKLGFSEKIPDNDELIEAFEEKFFQTVTYFHRRSFIPRLAEKMIEQLNWLCEVAVILQFVQSTDKQISNTPILEIYFSETTDISSIVRHYQKSEALIKQNLSRAMDPIQATAIYQEWLRLFDEYSYAFRESYTESEFYTVPIEVKASLHIDPMVIIEDLENPDSGSKSNLHLEFSRLVNIGAMN